MTRSTDIVAHLGQAAAGDEARPQQPAFDELYEAHFSFVWRCLRRLGVRSAVLDDACQDVFLVVHRRLAEYQPRVSPRAWLFAITRRVAHDYRRTEKRKGGGLPLISEPPAREPDPQRGAMCGEAAEIIMRFLETLPASQREAFVLSELEQLSAPEVASATSANVSTVYTRVHVARQALARFVRRHYPDAGNAGGGYDRG